MSVGFIAGGENAQAVQQLIEYAQSFVGLEEIRRTDMDPLHVLLCFETQEDAITAQWILDAMGAKEGGPS